MLSENDKEDSNSEKFKILTKRTIAKIYIWSKSYIKKKAVNSIELNEHKIEDLKTLGFVWGFLKYYHPNIASGNYNWDFELFRVLSKIIEAENTTERDEYLIKWINSIGEFEQIKKNILSYWFLF